MKKKIVLVLIVIILIPLFIFATYKFVKHIDYKNSLSNLEKYTFIENEKNIKSFEYDNQNYVISRYYDNSSSWSHLNLLLKDKNDYYNLESIKKCDTDDDGTNLYIKDNELYIHCIGKGGIIDKYLINNLNIEKETMNFNFKNTPNISQLHMGIDNVDNEYVYLSSPFKVDNTIKDEPRVKCSLKDKKCVYY
ncbi:MAG: hypothetical protein IK997_02280 [Bacilli bacterium]|nr:hypothetical protein [Bacilli bacterium]